jgi:hypothetical protein
MTIDGFAFDVELLYLARLAGFRIREVGITATAGMTAASACAPESRLCLMCCA